MRPTLGGRFYSGNSKHERRQIRLGYAV